MQPIRTATSMFKSAFRQRKAVNHISRCYLSRRASVVDILKEKPSEDAQISVKGWVKSLREHSGVTFINVSDGSGPAHLQVVVPTDKLPDDATFGSCVEAVGVLQPSLGRQQPTELAARSLQVIGPCDPWAYPFKARKRHTSDYVRQHIHLRPRTNQFSSLLRLRSAATHAVHQFFQEEGYCNIHTPIITANDCEGAGEVFLVQPGRAVEPLSDDEETGENEATPGGDEERTFFGVPAYLTVSGQLHLEVMTGAFDKVYTFNPTFRAENARGRHHLNEFYMIEAERAFTESLEDLMTVIERLIKFMTESLLNKHPEDIDLFLNHVAPKGHKERLDKIIKSDYIRMSYQEAIEVLKRSKETFEFKPEWGCDLQKEHERYLVRHCRHVPVFVTDFPAETKAFYARQNQDDKTVSAVDLLGSEVGELCGGSLREERLHVLHQKLIQAGGDDKLDWYLDLRRFGSSSHGGFGVGFERYLQAVLGIANIRDTIPFPRSRNNCKT